MVLNQTAPVDAARRKRTTLFFRRNINKIGTMGRVTATKFPHLDIPPKTPSSHGRLHIHWGTKQLACFGNKKHRQATWLIGPSNRLAVIYCNVALFVPLVCVCERGGGQLCAIGSFQSTPGHTIIDYLWYRASSNPHGNTLFQRVLYRPNIIDVPDLFPPNQLSRTVGTGKNPIGHEG